jgi:hypothetical protein
LSKKTRIAELEKWSLNPRRITAEKARILKKTLDAFGDLSGIVYNTKLKQLVGGHQRSDVLSQATIEITERFPKPTPQGTTAVGWAITQDGEKYAYREVQWNKQQHAAAAIAANKGAGDWDWALLKDLALELDTGAFDMELTGFDQKELEDMFTYEPPKEIDYSALDGAAVDDKIQIMASGIRKALQIEFRPEDFEQAKEAVRYWRDQDAYVGGLVLEFLQKKRAEHEAGTK